MDGANAFSLKPSHRHDENAANGLHELCGVDLVSLDERRLPSFPVPFVLD